MADEISENIPHIPPPITPKTPEAQAPQGPKVGHIEDQLQALDTKNEGPVRITDMPKLRAPVILEHGLQGMSGIGNPWFTPTAMTKFRQTFAELQKILMEQKREETEDIAQDLMVQMKIVQDVRALILAAAKTEQAMYITSAVAAGFQMAASIAGQALTSKMQKKAGEQYDKRAGEAASFKETDKTKYTQMMSEALTEKTTALQGAQQYGQTLQTALKGIVDAAENIEKGALTVEKSQYEATREVLRQAQEFKRGLIDNAQKAADAADQMLSETIRTLTDMIKSYGQASNPRG